MNTFTDSLRTDTIFFKHARGISDKSGKEFHLYHEIILFLGGDAEFITESIHITPKPGTLILIPEETYHQMVIHGEPTHYYRCVLQFQEIPGASRLISHAMKQAVVLSSDREINYLFQKLEQLAAEKPVAADLILQSCLILLLDQLRSISQIILPESRQSELIRNAVSYINEYPMMNLSVAQIAAKCNVSVSSLSHTFRKEMNIPLHQFMLKKRLIQAYHKISSGIPATTAALECGFSDYSGFYRQYKKLFGFSPSDGSSPRANIDL